jgi:hypothetical protein
MESESKRHLADLSTPCLTTSTTSCLDGSTRIPTERDLRAETRTRLCEERANQIEVLPQNVRDLHAQDTTEHIKESTLTFQRPTGAPTFEEEQVPCVKKTRCRAKLHLRKLYQTISYFSAGTTPQWSSDQFTSLDVEQRKDLCGIKYSYLYES